MRPLVLSAVALSFVVAAAPLASSAYAAMPAAAEDSAIPALPLEIFSTNGVAYVSGGISDEELAELKSKSKEFNLHVMLSAPKGEYISDVTLQILDSTGAKLVTVEDAGPYFYAHLKPGSYTLETWQKGDAEPKKALIEIPAKGVVSQHLVYKQ